MAAFDPSLSQILVALIGGGALALTATVQSYFTFKAAKASKAVVTSHIEVESMATERIAASLERHGGALDLILEWQGRHEAHHKADEAKVLAEAASVLARLSASEKIAEASQALVRDLHDRPHAPPVSADQ